MTPEETPSGSVRKLAPLVLLAAVVVAAYALGWHHFLVKELGLNYELLKSFVARSPMLSLAAFVAFYIAVVALSLPGGTFMTLAGGLLFGWIVGAAASVVSATIGATLLFLVARSSLGEGLVSRAGPWVERLRSGFRTNALSYLLFLRLVPVFPFVVVNLVPAILRVNAGTFVVATFFGIIPGTVAYSVAGAGLASVVEAQNKVYKDCLARVASIGSAHCDYRIDTSHLVTGELIAALVVLGLVALIPVGVKFWSKRNAAA